jgi:putative DNA primase/helicase
MPGYGDLQAYAPFADIDLEDGIKADRPGGDIPREAIEQALAMYIDAFADLAGGSEHVYALDSVGGAYVFIAPTATQPITDEFSSSDRGILLDDMTGRLNEWLKDVRDEINEAIPAVEGTFEPDQLNNKNRLYKAPLSIHSSLDGVTTPIDTEDPSYKYTPVEAVTDRLIDDAIRWAEGFTGDHHDAVETLVAGLWPEYCDCDDAAGWRDALHDRLDDLTAEAEQHQQQDDDSPDPRDYDYEALDIDPTDDDLETTDDIDVLNATIEAIDVKDLARSLVPPAGWDTAPTRDTTRFAAPWHSSHNSGTSCFVDSDKFVDLKEGKNGGGALKLIARERGFITHCRDTPTGDDYWKAVNALREEGYHIPFFEGKDGRHPDLLQLYDEPDDDDEKQRQAMRAIFCPRE